MRMSDACALWSSARRSMAPRILLDHDARSPKIDPECGESRGALRARGSSGTRGSRRGIVQFFFFLQETFINGRFVTRCGIVWTFFSSEILAVGRASSRVSSRVSFRASCRDSSESLVVRPQLNETAINSLAIVIYEARYILRRPLFRKRERRDALFFF